jgi:peptide deformylase
MAVFRLVLLGNPVLRSKAKSVPGNKIQTKKFQIFLDKLVQTCLHHQGVGIAAPQVGKSIRVIIIHIDPNNPRYPGRKFFPLTIVINPKISKQSKKMKEDWEGDLSVNLRGLVPRPISCTVTGLDRNGKKIVFDLQNDFHARVFQHEFDHLDGVMFLDKVEKKESFSTYEMWKKYWKGKNE